MTRYGRQAELFPVGKPLARATDPETSKEAAESLTEARVTEMEVKALRALFDLLGSGTNDDIVRVSGELWNAITPRMRPLAKKGLVREAGKRRSNRTNRSQIVWEITEAGSQALHSITKSDTPRGESNEP